MPDVSVSLPLAGSACVTLSAPSIWYEVGVDVKYQYRVVGMASPSLGGLIVTGDNGHIAWGSTSSTTDLTDIYFEVFAPPTPDGLPTVIFEGNPVPLEVQQVSRYTNIPDDGDPDTIVPATTVDILTVPHHGPIIQDLGEGTHTLPHEWLPNPGIDDPLSFAVVPIEEMPWEVNPKITEALGILSRWDFSTPTGIPDKREQLGFCGS